MLPGDIFMGVDSGDDGESARLLSAAERGAVARHVAEQLLAIARARRTTGASALARALAAARPVPLHDAAFAACEKVIEWLGPSVDPPALDGVLRAIASVLRGADAAERRLLEPLAMAACILAAAAMARSRSPAAPSDLPPGVSGEMVAASMRSGIDFDPPREAAE